MRCYDEVLIKSIVLILSVTLPLGFLISCLFNRVHIYGAVLKFVLCGWLMLMSVKVNYNALYVI